MVCFETTSPEALSILMFMGVVFLSICFVKIIEWLQEANRLMRKRKDSIGAKWLSNMKRRLNEQFWFLSGLYLIVVAFALRIFDAYILGNIFAAFSTDTFIGYPYFHILFFVGFAFVLRFVKVIWNELYICRITRFYWNRMGWLFIIYYICDCVIFN